MHDRLWADFPLDGGAAQSLHSPLAGKDERPHRGTTANGHYRRVAAKSRGVIAGFVSLLVGMITLWERALTRRPGKENRAFREKTLEYCRITSLQK
jgi:hypothetical protein